MSGPNKVINFLRAKCFENSKKQQLGIYSLFTWPSFTGMFFSLFKTNYWTLSSMGIKVYHNSLKSLSKNVC